MTKAGGLSYTNYCSLRFSCFSFVKYIFRKEFMYKIILVTKVLYNDLKRSLCTLNLYCTFILTL